MRSPSRAVSCAIPAERVGVGECALELGVGDRVRVARLAPPGVADGLLAVGVGPAGAVGDQLAVGAEQQVADDLPERVQLGIAGLDQPGADVVSEPEVGACRLGVAGPGLRAARRVLGGRVPQLVIVEARAGEVRVLAGRGRVALVELLVGEIEHERGVDHPDAGGEVRAAVVHERVRAGAGPVAHLGGDPDLHRPRPRAGGERVELGVEALNRGRPRLSLRNDLNNVERLRSDCRKPQRSEGSAGTRVRPGTRHKRARSERRIDRSEPTRNTNWRSGCEHPSGRAAVDISAAASGAIRQRPEARGDCFHDPGVLKPHDPYGDVALLRRAGVARLLRHVSDHGNALDHVTAGGANRPRDLGRVRRPRVAERSWGPGRSVPGVRVRARPCGREAFGVIRISALC
jgi:hypothetical protein